MSLSSAFTAATVALLLCAACGGSARETTASAGAGGVTSAGAGNAAGGAANPQAGAAGTAAGGACGSVPIPKDHRAVAQACPSERGSLGPLDMTTCTDRSGVTCTKDADCTAGKSGRCYLNGDKCQTVCSYDDCLTDTDCADGVCFCRSSDTDLVANECLSGGNCRTDSDCGGCEYCSPSVVPNSVDCGATCTCSGVARITYACHTASDECKNPSDCKGGDQYCGYDAGAQHWACSVCIDTSPPHP